MPVGFAPTPFLLLSTVTAVALLLQWRERAVANALMDGSSQNIGRACKAITSSAIKRWE
jgi:hypothetical protein